MKASEIHQGGRYVAKVSGKLTTVRVDAIRERTTYNGKWSTVYDVTNLATGRKTTFRSAAKFRREDEVTGETVAGPPGKRLIDVFAEEECGGVFDGVSTVHSDADEGL